MIGTQFSVLGSEGGPLNSREIIKGWDQDGLGERN